MADFRNVTMFIVQVLNSVLAILCEAKPALTCMAAREEQGMAGEVCLNAVGYFF